MPPKSWLVLSQPAINHFNMVKGTPQLNKSFSRLVLFILWEVMKPPNSRSNGCAE